MRRVARPQSLLCIVALLVSADAAAQSSSLASQVDSVFTRWIAPDAPGCAVGIYEADRVVHTRGYGLANVEHAVPNTPQTVFRIGGLSKQFTALSLVLLAQDGKLALDDAARTYVPELPDFGGTAITIRHLLNQTSGLRDFYPGALVRLAGGLPRDVVSTQRNLDYLSRQRSLNFPTGSRFAYGNLNFTVAGEIVRRVSGQGLPEFARARIFAPLGMAHTAYLMPQAIVPHHATAYGRAAGGRWNLNEPTNEADHGPGSVNSSVEDLAHWNGNLVTHRVGGDAGWATLVRLGLLNNGDAVPYGLGVQRRPFRGQDVISHQTRFWGYHASFIHFPAFGGGVAVLCNRPVPEGPTAIAQRVAAIAWPSRFAPEPAPLVPSASVRPESFAGVYVGAASRMLFQLRVSGDTIRVPQLGVLRLVGPDRYADGTGYTFELLPGATAADGRLIVTNEQDPYNVPDTLARVGSAWMPAQADLAPYAGKYYSQELDATLTVSVADDATNGWRLGVAPRVGGEPFAAVPAYRDLFAILLAPGGNMRFARDARGQVRGLEVNLLPGTVGVMFDRLPN